MPKVNHVKKARKAQGQCGKCGKDLNPGDAYRWWKFRYGGRRVRCMDEGCAPRPSDLTQSPFLAALYDAQDTLEECANAGGPEATGAALHEAADQLREVAEIRTEAADNMEDGFGHETEQSTQLREEGESVEYWADEVEDLASELDAWEDEDIEEEDLDDWVQEKVEQATGGCPV